MKLASVSTTGWRAWVPLPCPSRGPCSRRAPPSRPAAQLAARFSPMLAPSPRPGLPPPACHGSIRRTPTRANPRRAPGCARCRGRDALPNVGPRCRPSRAGLPDRRLPCDDWHLHVPPAACSPLRLDYPGSMDGNRYRPPYPASCHLIGETATRKGTRYRRRSRGPRALRQTDKLCGPCLKTARQQQVSRSPRFEFRPSWALTPTSERHALLERTVWHASHHLIHGLTRP